LITLLLQAAAVVARSSAEAVVQADFVQEPG